MRCLLRKQSTLRLGLALSARVAALVDMSTSAAGSRRVPHAHVNIEWTSNAYDGRRRCRDSERNVSILLQDVAAVSVAPGVRHYAFAECKNVRCNSLCQYSHVAQTWVVTVTCGYHIAYCAPPILTSDIVIHGVLACSIGHQSSAQLRHRVDDLLDIISKLVSRSGC